MSEIGKKYDLKLVLNTNSNYEVTGNSNYNNLIARAKKINAKMTYNKEHNINDEKAFDELESVKQELLDVYNEEVNIANVGFVNILYKFIQTRQSSVLSAASKDETFDMVQNIFQNDLNVMGKYLDEDTQLLFGAELNKKENNDDEIEAEAIGEPEISDDHEKLINKAVYELIYEDAYICYYGDLPKHIQTYFKNVFEDGVDFDKYRFLIKKDSKTKIADAAAFPVEDAEIINKKVEEFRNKKDKD